jgi:tRNA(Leu) C34 or U34 (ribose-2'-O)-methylase TrmL
MERTWWKKPSENCGRTPAVLLWNPKHAVNVGGALRNCAAWGMEQLWISGSRWENETARRLPREERMRIYTEEVEIYRSERPFDHFPAGTTPVAVELRSTAEVLTWDWEFPANPLFVFGPEDGSLGGAVPGLCHRQLVIPSRHCLNLANAVGVIGAVRMLWRMKTGLELPRAAKDLLFEERGRD